MKSCLNKFQLAKKNPCLTDYLIQNFSETHELLLPMSRKNFCNQLSGVASLLPAQTLDSSYEPKGRLHSILHCSQWLAAFNHDPDSPSGFKQQLVRCDHSEESSTCAFTTVFQHRIKEKKRNCDNFQRLSSRARTYSLKNLIPNYFLKFGMSL